MQDQDRVSGLRYMAAEGACRPTMKPFCPHALNADRILKTPCKPLPSFSLRGAILRHRILLEAPAVTWYLRYLGFSTD